MSEQPTAASGESDYLVAPDDSNKKPSLFGKLKDRTKKAGSKIKSKVKKNNPDGTPAEHDDDEDDETYSDDAPSPTSAPVTSAPRDFTTSEPSRFSGSKDKSGAPDISGLSINEPSPFSQGKSQDEPTYSEPQYKPYSDEQYKPSNEPSYTDSQSKPFNEPSYMDSQSKLFNEPSYTDSQSKPFNEPSYTDSQSKPFDEPSYSDSQSKPYSEPSYDEPQSKPFGGSQSNEPSQPQESFQEASEYPSQEPTFTEKASGATQGAKDALYGGAAATAGALGYGAAKEGDHDKPLSEKASDTAYDARSKVEEVGDRGYDRATDAKDRVAGQSQGTFGLPGSEPTAADRAAETRDAAASKAYDAKDAVQSKAYDLNNATNDSETYTEKASKTAQAAKDSAAAALGVGAASEGPSLVEKAKQTMGFDSVPASEGGPTATEKADWKAHEAKDQAGYKAGETADAAQSKAYEAKDAVQSKAADVNNSTDDSQTYTQKATNAAQSARDSAAGALGIDQTSQGPSLVDKAKDTMGMNKEGPSVVDTAKDNLASTVDTTKAYAVDAAGTAQNYANQARDTAVDTATPKQEDKALSEKITDVLGGLPGRAQATATGVTQSATAKTPTTTTPGTVTDVHTSQVEGPASPGIFNKLGGLFGYGAKAPEHHDPTHTGATTTTPQPPSTTQ